MEVSQAYVLLFILLCLSILAIVGCMVRLVLHTKENSISGMIAQRYNPTSYVCVIAIACFSMLTSATVIIGEVESPPGWTSTDDETEWSVNPDCGSYQSECSAVVWLNTFSPIVCMCILFFPLVVVRSDRLLKMRPYIIGKKDPLEIAKPTHVIVTRQDELQLSCCGRLFYDGEAEVPDDNIRQVFHEVEIQQPPVIQPPAAESKTLPSEIEMTPVHSTTTNSPPALGSTGGGEVPIAIDSVVKKTPTGWEPLKPEDIKDEEKGLPVVYFEKEKQWRVASTVTTEEAQSGGTKKPALQSTVWKAWELVLWNTAYFPTYLYSVFHYLSVGTGIALGWTGLSIYLRFVFAGDSTGWTCCGYTNSRTVPKVLVTLLLAGSVLCAVIFTVMGIWLPLWPRSRTLFEGICLLTVDLAIIFAALYGNSLV